MNKEETGLFNDLWHIGTDMMSWDYKEPADELKEKIIKTFEENKLLKDKVNQLETNRDEVIELINKDRNKEYGSLEKKSFYCSKTNKLLEILERGKE